MGPIKGRGCLVSLFLVLLKCGHVMSVDVAESGQDDPGGGRFGTSRDGLVQYGVSHTSVPRESNGVPR